MCDSRAKVLAVAASPRYEPCGSGEAAGWYSTRRLGTAYGGWIAIGPEFTFRNAHAWSLPSASAPDRTSMTAAGRK